VADPTPNQIAWQKLKADPVAFAAHKDKQRLRQRKYYNTKARYASHLKHRYGITVEQRDSMLSAQGGLCAICRGNDPKRGKGWCVDHCHKTEKIRGILCHDCNVALGLLQDSPTILTAAADYLRKV
jgi:hypothetical protein